MNKNTTSTCMIVVRDTVKQRLTSTQTNEALVQLDETMKSPDPDNPGLWVVEVDGFELWAIIDPGAGPEGQDVVMVLFPEDY